MAESSPLSPANKKPPPTAVGDGSGLCTRDPSLKVSHEADGFRLLARYSKVARAEPSFNFEI
jgi:hypothetical protein